MRKTTHGLVIILLVGSLALSVMPILNASAFLINKDVKQVFADPQDNFEILLEGDWRDVETDLTINPFSNGQVQISYNAGAGTTTVSFSGDAIDQDPNVEHHFGFGFGIRKNHGKILREYWTNGSVSSNVSGGSSRYNYDPLSQTVLVEVSNDIGEATVISDVGYLIFSEEQPLADMNRSTMPPASFTASGITNNTVLNPGESVFFEISEVLSTDWIVTFQSVRFEDPPPGGYDEDVGEWVQVSASEAAPPTGGIIMPVNILELLAPYIISAALIISAVAATTLYVKRKKNQ